MPLPLEAWWVLSRVGRGKDRFELDAAAEARLDMNGAALDETLRPAGAVAVAVAVNGSRGASNGN